MLSKSMSLELGPPGGQRLAAKEPVALEPQIEHPFRLVLEPGDVGDDLRGQATLRRGSGNITIRPAPLIVTERSQMLILRLAGTDRSGDSGILSLGHDHGLSDVVISVVVLRPDGRDTCGT